MRAGIVGGFTDKKSKDKNWIEENFSCSSIEDSHHRRVVLQSKVDWQDSKKHPKGSGKFRVFVTAEVNESVSMDDRSLRGHILIYPLSAESMDKKKIYAMNVHSLCHDIKNQKNDRQKQFKQLEEITSGKVNVDNLTLFSSSLKFEVSPNGVTKIEHVKNNFGLDNATQFFMARQAYYYLKYSIHTHKHHTAKQDSLTTITELSKVDNQDGMRLICQLKRELTSIQRMQNIDGKEHASNNAVGIIAYIKSLILSLHNENIISDDVKQIELDRFQYVKDSFIAQENKIESNVSTIETIKSKSKVWLGFLLISLWSAFNFTFKSDSSNKTLLSTVDMVMAAPLALIFVFLVYQAITHYYRRGMKPEASEHLYHTGYWIIALKITLSSIIGYLLIALV